MQDDREAVQQSVEEDAVVRMPLTDWVSSVRRRDLTGTRFYPR